MPSTEVFPPSIVPNGCTDKFPIKSILKKTASQGEGDISNSNHNEYHLVNAFNRQVTIQDDINKNLSERKISGGGLKSLEEQIDDVAVAVDTFFRNKFEESEQLLISDPNHEQYVYYKIGRAAKAYIVALITMEKPEIKIAFERVNAVLSHVKKLRKQSTLSSWFFKTDYNLYTDEEAHAEVLFAEASIMSLILTMLSDVSFMAIVTTPFKLRAIYNAYQLAIKIAEGKTNWASEKIKVNFLDAAYAGWGLMSILMSHLPERVTKLLRFVGYEYANREEGFQLCRDITSRDETFLAKAVQCIVCFYSLYLSQIFGVGSTHLDYVEEMTSKALQKFSDGVFDLFFRAKLEQITGNNDKAVDMFNKCISVQDEYQGLQNVATWDLIWCYAMRGDWHRASDSAKYLEINCNWSKVTNLYQWACFQYMIMEEEGRPELMTGIREAMAKVPEYRKRYVGKTIPVEKFAITKAMQFTEGKLEKLHLPAYELFYMWNIFNNTGGRKELLDPIMSRIDKKFQDLRMENDESMYVMYLLKGVCLRNYGKHEEAISCFREILDAENIIQKVTYVPPHAAMEIGLSYLTVGRVDEAKSWLHKARDEYTGFLVESLAHLRIHGALAGIRYNEM